MLAFYQKNIDENPPPMVTPKLALTTSITGPIQKTKYVEGCNTTSKRI